MAIVLQPCHSKGDVDSDTYVAFSPHDQELLSELLQVLSVALVRISMSNI